jgi:hypothetical protein
MFCSMAALGVGLVLGPSEAPRWVHPMAQALDVGRHGPFVGLADGTLATLDGEGFRISHDDGRTWSAATPVCPGINAKEPASYYIVRTRRGALVVVYLNFDGYHFAWNADRNEPEPDCKLEVWSIRSLDGGKTWVDNQRLLGGYNANFFGLIETRSGHLVVPLEHLVTEPGRWVCCSMFSEDDGRTWKRSNWIDLGGHGDHDGALEPTVAELSDSRLLMLIRTNLDRLWQAVSDDGGRNWRTIQPSPLDASSAPGYLLRLRSGRLALAWNRLNPEGGQAARRANPRMTEQPASWHREELAIALSADDGRTWTKPLVIARQPGGQLSYPYLFERRPGELWLLAGFAFQDGWKEPLPLRVKLDERALVGAQ